MYNDDVTRIPVDSEDLWELLEEQFEFVRHILWDLPAEPVFTIQWNRHGVFKMDNFEEGPWQKQLRRALARPDLHLT